MIQKVKLLVITLALFDVGHAFEHNLSDFGSNPFTVPVGDLLASHWIEVSGPAPKHVQWVEHSARDFRDHGVSHKPDGLSKFELLTQVGPRICIILDFQFHSIFKTSEGAACNGDNVFSENVLDLSTNFDHCPLLWRVLYLGLPCLNLFA